MFVSRRRALCAAAAALVLTGCATGPKFVRHAPVGPSEALVYIYRPAGFFGSGMRPDVKIDGVLIGTLSVGSYMVKPLAAGTHQLLLTGNGNFLKWNYADRVVQIDARPGSTLYFRYTASSNMVNASTMALGYTFQAVSEATALEEMTELNRVE